MKTRTLVVASAMILLTAGCAGRASEPEPTTLKVIMGELGAQMARAHEALWAEDFAALSTAARAVADHPHVSAPERTRVQRALGPDFAGFVAADKAVHDAAVELSAAAAAEDMARTLAALHTLQTGCVACHTDYRERLAGVGP